MSTDPTVNTTDPNIPTMTRAEAVEYLTRLGVPGVTERYLLYATREGKLSCHKIANRNTYSLADLHEFLNRQRIANKYEAANNGGVA